MESSTGAIRIPIVRPKSRENGKTKREEDDIMLNNPYIYLALFHARQRELWKEAEITRLVNEERDHTARLQGNCSASAARARWPQALGHDAALYRRER